MVRKSRQWQLERQTLEILSSLSYRTGELSSYLHAIACGVSQLIGVDWSVVTLCQQGFERVLASSIDLGEAANQIYSLHGILTGTVVQTGQSLIVPDARTCKDYGEPPEGYRAYLGVPLRPAHGEVIGTICSFHKKTRKFAPEEILIVELFAERAATAIDNYHLYQQQCQFNERLEIEVANRTEELRMTQAKLVEQERLAAMGEFAATIVHEIRNPLTTVRMGLNFFQRLDLSEPAQVRLDLALEEADRLERLLGEILLYAKPQVLQLIEIDINEFMQKLLEPLCNMPEAWGRKLELVPVIGATKVFGDEDKLKQVFINLVRNACEAIAEGETVRLQIKDYRKTHQICIQIHNGGDPIPSDILSTIMLPFYTTKPSGTGLGLAITKRIVEAHGGKLSIQSSTADGTTVSVILPLEQN